MNSGSTELGAGVSRVIRDMISLGVLPQLLTNSVEFNLTDPPCMTKYKPRHGRTVPNDGNDAWLKPALAQMFRVS